MSYTQAMKWRRKHPRGTKQPVLMSTGSGFWPSQSYLFDCYFPYVEQCKSQGIDPMGCEAYYRATLSGAEGNPRLTVSA